MEKLFYVLLLYELLFSALYPLIDAANASLLNAVSTWDGISQRIISYNVDVANVSALSAGTVWETWSG